MTITSLKNPRVKTVVRLRQRRGRDQANKVLIEGYRGLLRAVDAAYPVDELYVCPELFQGENERELIERLRQGGCTVFEASAEVFGKMAYRDRPEGLLGVGPQCHRTLEDLTPAACDAPLYLVAESIEKPGNLGTMFRTADATGVAGLIVCDSRTDLFNPNVVRASTGNLFTVPFAEAGTDETIQWLHTHGIRIAAATPHAGRRYTEEDVSGPLAIVVGAEQYGLSQAWLDRCDMPVRIPMFGVADSLNVATATALLLYEAVRQRLEKGTAEDRGPVPDD